MGLAQYKPQSYEFPIADGPVISVTGLSLSMISRLLNIHYQDIAPLFELFERNEKVEEGNFQSLALGLIAEAPGFVANVIALAAGEEDSAANAERLPAPVQIELLARILDLTFKEVGGVGKTMETVTSLLQSMRNRKALEPTSTR
jgi:hypothetical protein